MSGRRFTMRMENGKAVLDPRYMAGSTADIVEHLAKLEENAEKLEHRAELSEKALSIAAAQLKCRGGIGKGFCRVDNCDYYNCNNTEGCIKAHLRQAEKELKAEERKDEYQK